MSALLKPIHKEPPDQVLRKQVGDISELDLFHNWVLVAIYIRPATSTLGGKEFHYADRTRDEDKYQGVVGLVLKKGAAAFQDDVTKTFHGNNVEVGDWVFFRASDGPKMQ